MGAAGVEVLIEPIWAEPVGGAIGGLDRGLFEHQGFYLSDRRVAQMAQDRP